MKQQMQITHRRPQARDHSADRRHRAREESGISTFLPSIDQVLATVANDYQRAANLLQNRSKAANLSVHELNYLIGAAGFALGRILEDDDEVWERFVESKALPRQTKLNRVYCLRYALMCMHGAASGKVAARARDHARALQGLWDAGASAREAYEQLKKAGFDGLKRAGTAATAPRAVGLRGRKPRTLYVGDRGCKTIDALERGQIAIAAIESVPGRGKPRHRTVRVVNIDGSRLAALMRWLKDVEGEAPAARGRRRA